MSQLEQTGFLLMGFFLEAIFHTYSRHKQIRFSILMTFSKNIVGPKLCGPQRLKVYDVNIFLKWKNQTKQFVRDRSTLWQRDTHLLTNAMT